MKGDRINAWINYYRTFGKVSNQALADSIGRSLSLYQHRLSSPEKFTIGELMTICDRLHVTDDSRRDLFEEVMKAWKESK